jgi:UDP-glucose 4-epimerase
MIIVTGATGFVGRYLVDQLVADGVGVVATGKSERGKAYCKKAGIPFVLLDVTKEEDFNNLPKENVDAVVHLAALLSIDVAQWTAKDYLMTNALGTYNVLEYCRKSGSKKIIYAMTHSDVNRSKDLVITEETPREFGSTVGPGNTLPYIVSKIAAMNFIEVYTKEDFEKPPKTSENTTKVYKEETITRGKSKSSKEAGIQGIILRFPGIRGYGSRDSHYDTVFHRFIQKAIRSEPIEIWGEHKTVRDLVYIKDVIAAIISALKSEKANGLYNIGSGKGMTIEDEAKAIIKVFSPPDNPPKIIYRPDIKEVRKRSYIFDISKAKRDFGYSPKYSYEEAMIDYKKEMESGKFNELG